jgi:hypothetical protein
MGDLVPRKDLVKNGSKGIGGIVGGALILILNAFGPIASLIVGGILGVTGLGMSRNKEEKTTGMLVAAAGALTAFTAIPKIGGLGTALLVISGVGLILMGGWNLIKFIRGYRKRL